MGDHTAGPSYSKRLWQLRVAYAMLLLLLAALSVVWAYHGLSTFTYLLALLLWLVPASVVALRSKELHEDPNKD